jgi:hypothetical protein
MKWIKVARYGKDYFKLYNKNFELISAFVDKEEHEQDEDESGARKQKLKPWHISVSLEDYSGDGHEVHDDYYEKRSSAFKAIEGYINKIYSDFGKMLKVKSIKNYASMPENDYLRELKQERKLAEAREIDEIKKAAKEKAKFDKSNKKIKENLPSVLKANQKKAELLKKYASKEVDLQNSL